MLSQFGSEIMCQPMRLTEGVQIGSGSVVAGDCDPGCSGNVVVAGVPARVIKTIGREDQQKTVSGRCSTYTLILVNRIHALGLHQGRSSSLVCSDRILKERNDA